MVHLLIIFIIVSSSLLTFQGAFTLMWMLYAWESPESVEKNKSPKSYITPRYAFSAIVPVRHEDKVIGDTIRAIASIDYPEQLKEVLIVCRADDTLTLQSIKKTIDDLPHTNIQLIIFNDKPINKPHALNIGLKKATKDVIVVFDAEDQPHKDIYQIVNTVMQEKHADVVQSGVQLMNFWSRWFSPLNVIEYYFWFKSALHFFSRCGFILLGGNSVFFKKSLLTKIGGWDETTLTEDADIGIRMSIHGAKIAVVYDEKHATQEETPPNLQNFIKQRTRWNQGFIHVLSKADWLHLPKIPQKIIAGYMLVSAHIQALLFLYIPVAIIMAIQFKFPVWVVLFSTLPIYLLLLQFIIYNIGLYEFTRDYKLKYPILTPLKVLLAFYPYQIILGFSAFRAVIRFTAGKQSWEKTSHINAHRKLTTSRTISLVPTT